jgi:hypothetical protein
MQSATMVLASDREALEDNAKTWTAQAVLLEGIDDYALKIGNNIALLNSLLAGELKLSDLRALPSVADVDEHQRDGGSSDNNKGE